MGKCNNLRLWHRHSRLPHPTLPKTRLGAPARDSGQQVSAVPSGFQSRCRFGFRVWRKCGVPPHRRPVKIPITNKRRVKVCSLREKKLHGRTSDDVGLTFFFLLYFFYVFLIVVVTYNLSYFVLCFFFNLTAIHWTLYIVYITRSLRL